MFDLFVVETATLTGWPSKSRHPHVVYYPQKLSEHVHVLVLVLVLVGVRVLAVLF